MTYRDGVYRFSAAVLAISTCALLSDAAFHFVFQWERVGTWRYLLLPVAAYMVWVERGRLRAPSESANLAAGVPLLALGALMHFAGHVSTVEILVESAAMLWLVGLGFVLLGTRRAAVFSWPIIYVYFMISVAARYVPDMAIHMQRVSAAAATAWMNLMGWPVLRQGLVLSLPGRPLRIAYWCSGANQLVSLLALAVPIALVRHRNVLSRVVVVLSTIPTALFFNTLRIVLIALWNYNEPRQSLHGPHEIFLIPVIHPFAIAVLVGVSVLMYWLMREGRTERGSH